MAKETQYDVFLSHNSQDKPAVGAPNNSAVRFRMGGIVCLEGAGDDWAVKWVIRPELVT